MKRLIGLLMVGVMAFGLMGCDVTVEKTPNQDDTAKTTAIASKADLEGKKIAVQEGTTGDLLATDEIKGAKISRFKKVVDTGIELKNGRVDAIVVDELPAKKLVEKNPEFKILDEKLSNEEYAIAVKKGNKELLDKINSTLKRIKEDGTHQALRDAFMPETEVKSSVPAIADGKGEKLIMGTNASFEPFEYRDDNNKVAGFDIEIARNIAKDMDRQLEITDIDFDSLIGALSSGKIDFAIAGMTVTEERLKNVDFSDPYYNASQVIIVKK